jgi:hypothetical protein
MVSIVHDPKQAAKSEMLKRPKVCNGEANGKPCKHYWTLVRLADVVNPEVFNQGEKVRMCTAFQGNDGPMVFEDGGTDMAVECSRYEVDPRPERAYRPEFEEFRPKSHEELVQIGASAPTPAQGTFVAASIDDVLADEDEPQEDEDEE